MLFSSFKAINDNRRSNLRCVLDHHSISYIPWALFRQLLLRLPGNQLYPVDVIKTNVNNNKNNLFKFVPFFPNQTDQLFIALQRRAFLVENKQWFHPRDAWEDSKVKIQLPTQTDIDTFLWRELKAQFWFKNPSKSNNIPYRLERGYHVNFARKSCPHEYFGDF